MKRKNVILVTFLLTMLVSLMFSQSVWAKNKVKLNYNKKILFVGDKVKLKVKNTKKKIKWSSKNKKIAEVSSKGRIKAKKAGKTVIIAKVGKKRYKCKITVKKKKYKIIDREIGYYTSDLKPEGTYYLSFGLKWKGKEVSCDGKCDIVFMNNNNKILKTHTVKFSSKDFCDVEINNLLKYRCEIDININDKPKELLGDGKIGFIIRLNNGQTFSLYKEDTYFTGSASSGEIIKFDNISVVLPIFGTVSTYLGDVRVSALKINKVEYSYSRNFNGTYNFEFWINGRKTYDFLGNSGTVECGLCYSIQKDGNNIMLKDSNIPNLEGRYSISQPLGNRKVGENVGTYPTNCDLSKGTYQLVISDYYY